MFLYEHVLEQRLKRIAGVVPRQRVPLRGEIDPPGKGRRPVVIVLLDARNRRARADTVLVVPLSTSVHRRDVPTHVFLSAGETGLQADSIARAET